MKKSNLLFTALCVFCILLISSCNPKERIINNQIEYDTIQVNQSYYIENDSTKPGCNIKIAFIYPNAASENIPLKSIQTLFTEKIFGEDFKNASPEEATDEYIKHYINDFKNFISLTENKNDQDENIYMDETGYSYYIKLNNNLVYNKNGFISFTVESVSYEGGAHNSKSIYGYVYDINSHKLITESDFGGQNYETNIARILSEKIAESNGVKNIKDLENLGYNSIADIKPNNNFTFDDKGITYYFNENEIAATMVGINSVFIPYEELNMYVLSDFPLYYLMTE